MALNLLDSKGQLLATLRPGGHAIVGTFGPERPTQCSGLPVARYEAGALHDEFGGQFVYCFCRLGH